MADSTGLQWWQSPSVTSLEDIIAAWAAGVRADGGVPTVFPSQAGTLWTGKRAERFTWATAQARTDAWYDYGAPPYSTDTLDYWPAPYAVQQASDALAAQDRADISAAAKLQMYQDAMAAGVAWLGSAVTKTGQLVLSLPRNTLAAVLGIPSWAITAGIILGVVVLFNAIVPSVPKIIERRYR